jgi:hypothetical protein
MKREAELPNLTDQQLDTLRRFAMLEIGVPDMLHSLAGVFEVDFQSRHQPEPDLFPCRMASGHFRMPEPGIVITRDHISNALDLKRADLVSERDLVHWAFILLSNDAYVLDPGDEDLIAEWLNDISLILDAS